MDVHAPSKRPPNGRAVGPESPIERIFRLHEQHRAALKATTARARAAKLRRLRDVLLRRRADIHAALYADFRKPPEEVDLTELGVVLSEIKHTTHHLARWMKPSRADTLLPFAGATSEVIYEPKGTALILSPWNYPINLTLGPLVSAVAAGCPVIIKPSEYTPHASRLTSEILAACFDEREVAVFEGGVETAQALLKLPFGHIYFTGSPSVGQIVMKAAAEHLTSVTLELGGKSPALVDASADLDDAARKIAWGKFSNAGQTCIAPDYVLVDDAVHDDFVVALRAHVEDFFGATPEARQRSRDYARIVSEQHAERLAELVEGALDAGAELALGGEVDLSDRYIAPTVLTSVPRGAAVMQEEIFGPILPLVRYRTLDDALTIVGEHPNPLALYIFSENAAFVDRVLQGTTAGTTGVNETLLHFSNPALPFGGIRQSGIGRGHGHAGFLAFSNERATMTRKVGSKLWARLFPPYTPTSRTLIDTFLKYF